MYVGIEQDDGGGFAWVVLGALRVQVPDQRDRSPPDWWVVEALTGVPAERVVDGWKAQTNQPLEDAVAYLIRVVDEFADDAFDSVGSLRRAAVHARFVTGSTPVLFVRRPDQTVQRARALLEDCLGGVLFRVETGRGLRGAMVRTLDGKADLLVLDDADKARGLLLRTIRFARPGHPPKPCAQPPPVVVADLVSFPPEWPRLDGIVRLPSVREDGSVSSIVGYDAPSRLWYEPEAAFTGVEVPDDPTPADVDSARVLLLEPIAEFPFVDGPAAALAMLIERVALPLLTGPRPLYVIDAPPSGQGTGKTLLARVFGAVALGRDPPVTSYQGRDEEMRKLITSLLRAGDAVHIFDNITGLVSSDALAQLATSREWRARVLGVSDAPALPNLALWVLTINGARLSRDIARRVVLVRLDAQVRDAWRRSSFRIRDVVAWALAHRTGLVRAALVLVRAWVRAGCPRDPALAGVRGGFERWCDVVGGVLAFAGVAGLPAALRVAEERDVESAEDAAFVEAWRSQFGDAWVTSANLAELAERLGFYEAVLSGARGTWGPRRIAEQVLSRLLGREVEVHRAGTQAYYRPMAKHSENA